VTPPSPRQYRSASAATTASVASSIYTSSSQSVCTTPPSSDDEGVYEDDLPPPCEFDLDLDEFDFHFGDEDNDADDDLDDDDDDDTPLLTPRSPLQENIVTVKREEFGEDNFSSTRLLFEGRDLGLGEGPCYMRPGDYFSQDITALFCKSSMRFSPSLLPDPNLQLSALSPFTKVPPTPTSTRGSFASSMVEEGADRVVKSEAVDVGSLEKADEDASGMWTSAVASDESMVEMSLDTEDMPRVEEGIDNVDVVMSMDMDRDMSHMLGPESVLVDELDREWGWDGDVEDGSAVEEVKVVTRRYSPGMSVPLVSVGAQNGERRTSGVKRREPDSDEEMDRERDFGMRKRQCTGMNSSSLEFVSKIGEVGSSNAPVVANTCTLLDPPITATILDGMPLFRTTCGSQILVRRIDTDFVNLTNLNFISTPSLKHDALTRLVSSCAGRLDVVSGKHHGLRGTWVPLQFVRQLITQGTLNLPLEVRDVFLGDGLGDLFPPPVPQVRAVIANANVGVGGEAEIVASGTVSVAVAAIPNRNAQNIEPVELSSKSESDSEAILLSPSSAAAPGTNPVPMPLSFSLSVAGPMPDMDRVQLCSSVVSPKRGRPRTRGVSGSSATFTRPRRNTRSASGSVAPVQAANARTSTARTLRSGRSLPA